MYISFLQCYVVDGRSVLERLKEGGGGGSEGGEEVKEGEGEGEREGEGGEEKEGPLPVKTSVELYVDVEKIEVRLMTYMLINTCK